MSDLYDAATFERLLAISLKLNSTLDLDLLLPFIIETAAELLDSEGASVLLYNEEEEALKFVAATGTDPDILAQIPVPLNSSIAGRIYRTGETVIEQDVSTRKDHFKKVGEESKFETRSLLGVPLLIEGQPTGVLEAINKRDGLYTERDVAVLKVIANQAALALRKAEQVQLVQQAYDELASFETFRSSFITMASHELRTPMSIMTQVLQLVQHSHPEVETELVESALQSGERAERVLNAMAQLELLRAETVQHVRKLVNVSALVEATVHDLQSDRKTGQVIQVHPPPYPIDVLSEPGRLRQVLTNVLHNAIAFSPVGGLIEIHQTLMGHELHLIVIDHGVGLDPEHTERIFDEYFQVEDALTRSHEGLGIGLSIARRLVAIDGGSIQAESKGLGHGTTVHIRYPDASRTDH
ncbi:MAG: hypothetical protein RhofKO_21440 [Rhodothermales bacterium]